MPGNGAPLLWNQAAPADTDNAGAGAGEFRSLKTSLEAGLAVEHNWPTVSGPNFGVHLPGSARAYYDLQSNVSSTGTDGRLMVASDVSRLFHVGSGGTMLLGGASALMVMGAAAPSGDYLSNWASEMTTMVSDAQGRISWTFASAYNGAPFVLATAGPQNGAAAIVLPLVDRVTASDVSLLVINAAGVGNPARTVTIMSIGSRLLTRLF